MSEGVRVLPRGISSRRYRLTVTRCVAKCVAKACEGREELYCMREISKKFIAPRVDRTPDLHISSVDSYECGALPLCYTGDN